MHFSCVEMLSALKDFKSTNAWVEAHRRFCAILEREVKAGVHIRHVQRCGHIVSVFQDFVTIDGRVFVCPNRRNLHHEVGKDEHSKAK